MKKTRFIRHGDVILHPTRKRMLSRDRKTELVLKEEDGTYSVNID